MHLQHKTGENTGSQHAGVAALSGPYMETAGEVCANATDSPQWLQSALCEAPSMVNHQVVARSQ